MVMSHPDLLRISFVVLVTSDYSLREATVAFSHPGLLCACFVLVVGSSHGNVLHCQISWGQVQVPCPCNGSDTCKR